MLFRCAAVAVAVLFRCAAVAVTLGLSVRYLGTWRRRLSRDDGDDDRRGKRDPRERDVALVCGRSWNAVIPRDQHHLEAMAEAAGGWRIDDELMAPEVCISSLPCCLPLCLVMASPIGIAVVSGVFTQ